MKKTILSVVLALCSSTAFAAQQDIPYTGSVKWNTAGKRIQDNFTDLYTNKADKTSFASQSAFTTAWGWTPGGVSAWSDVQALISGTGDYIKYDGTRGNPSGATYTAGSNITISPENVISATGTLSGTVDWDSVTDKPTETPISASIVTNLFPGTGACLGKNNEAVDCGGSGAGAIADLTDWPSGLTATEIEYVNGVTGPIQSQIDAISAGGIPHVASGYPSTAGAWNFNTTDYKLYTRLASGDVYSTSALTLAAAADVTPEGFAFTDMPDATLSTEYTACDQVTGIDWPATVTASGSGGAAICTGNNTGCGTFGTAPGTVENDGWVCARHTSSASNSTDTNTPVTVGTVSDTFTSTTVASVSNGSIGITTYNTESSSRAASTIYLSKYTATAGNINCLYALTRYVNTGGTSIDIGIWNSAGTFLGYVNAAGNGESVATWKNGKIASTITLASADYWIGAVSDDASWSMYYDNTAGNGRGTVVGTLGSLGNITPPTTTVGQQYTFYADYQEDSCVNPQ